MTDDSLLTVAEVAQLLKVNQQTVRNWIDAGSLPAIRLGRVVRIKRIDLKTLLEAASNGAAPAAPPQAGPTAADFWGGTTALEPSRPVLGPSDR